MFYNISPPHMPLADAPDEYLTMYRDADVVVRPNVDLSRPVHKQEWEFHTYLWDFRYYRDHLPYTRKLPAGFDLRRLMALYMGLTTWVDDALGRMLQALEAAGLADRTVVVFTSDHGDNLGSHQRMGKSTLNEESIRIPLIVRGPGVAPRAVDRQAASLVDLAPTLLEMAGVAAPPSMQGRSLAPVLRGASEEPRFNAAFIECARDGCGLRTPTHLYGLPWVGNGTLGPKPHYFHDLTTDPYQLHNLAESKEQEEAMTALDRRLRDLDRQVKWSAGRTVS
jgi:choline-sulfatase